MTLQLIILLLSYSMNYTCHLICFPLYKCSPVCTLPSAASFVFLRGWNETKQGLGNLMSHIKTAQECFCRSIFASLSDSMANCKLISFYFFCSRVHRFVSKSKSCLVEGAKERYCDSFSRRIFWCCICALLSHKLASQAFGNQDQCRN